MITSPLKLIWRKVIIDFIQPTLAVIVKKTTDFIDNDTAQLNCSTKMSKKFEV
jgi:hypothetical protein